MEKIKRIKTEVAIIGSGGAGLRAAIEACDNGADVLVISKAMHRKAHTVMAEGGIAAPLGNIDGRDNWKVHANDTLEDGLYLGNRKMIETLCKSANSIILELDNWGCIFDRTDKGKIHQRPFGAHTYPRVCHIGDRTGLEIVQVLADQVRKRKIKYLEEFVVSNLILDSGNVSGVCGVNLISGEFVFVECKSVIISTGGYARIFKTTTNPWECTGDGYAIAYNHGVALVDMEMVQFHPTGMVAPESAKGILVTESVRGDGGYLTNIKGERFMKKYDSKRMELSARDVVARSIYLEIQAGRGTSNSAVYLDISHKPRDYILKRLPKMVQQFLDFAGIDITKTKFEVSPTAHYTMGGIKVDALSMMTSVKGLFAAGEVTVSVHGANRLGGNSLIDILVFGKLAGKGAANYCKKISKVTVDDKKVETEFKRIMKPFSNKKGVKPQTIKNKIPDIMWKYCGIARDSKSLKKGLSLILQLKKEMLNVKVNGSLKFNHEFTDFLDVQNMLICGEATIRSALFRTESRGAHFRTDFLKTDDKWLCNTVCQNLKGKMEIKKEKIANHKKF